MGVAPEADGLSAVNALLAKFDTANETIQFSVAFPKYSSFDRTSTTQPRSPMASPAARSRCTAI
jgi:hypothetical protein